MGNDRTAAFFRPVFTCLFIAAAFRGVESATPHHLPPLWKDVLHLSIRVSADEAL